MIYCAVCQRRMQGQYNHGAAYYRCRFPQEYALANEVEHPRNVYLREDALTDPLDEWLASAFTPDHLDRTITAMCDAQPTDTTPQTAAAQATIAACDAKFAQYRAALDAGADPALVTGWITETQAERTRVEADLQTTQQTEPRRMRRSQIADLVRALGETSPPCCATPTPTTKLRSTGNSDCDSPTRPKRKRCALQWISARTVGLWFVSEGQHDPLPHRR
ncbi:zinc ribbon domain-containing protein [Micromonospora arida]